MEAYIYGEVHAPVRLNANTYRNFYQCEKDTCARNELKLNQIPFLSYFKQSIFERLIGRENDMPIQYKSRYVYFLMIYHS